MKVANEGLRPYWYDSSILENRTQFRLRFYYPANIGSITILDKTTGTKTIIKVDKEGKYLYIFGDGSVGLNRNGVYNKGDTVIYDQRQEKPIHSNRISKR